VPSQHGNHSFSPQGTDLPSADVFLISIGIVEYLKLALKIRRQKLIMYIIDSET
jgi:hypothetical protein